MNYAGALSRRKSGASNPYGKDVAPQAPNIYERASQQRRETMPMPSLAPQQPMMGAPSMGAPSPGRMPMPAPSMGAPAPMQTNNIFDKIREHQANPGGAPAPTTGPGMHNLDGWSEADKKLWNEIAASIQAMPDFAGKNGMYHTALAQFEMMKNMQRSQPAIDYSGSSEVADQFNNQRSQMQDALAARGISGSGAEAGALANSYGSQARAMGSFYRDAQETRRREQLAQLNAWLQRTFGMQQQGLERVYAKEDEPSFGQEALGVLGGIAGNLAPGLIPGNTQKVAGSIPGMGGAGAGGGGGMAPGYGGTSWNDYEPNPYGTGWY